MPRALMAVAPRTTELVEDDESPLADRAAFPLRPTQTAGGSSRAG